MYQRTPIPSSLAGIPFLYLSLILFSPFVAIGVNALLHTGTWFPGTVSVVIGFLGIARRAYRYRFEIPPAVRREYTHGKLFAPLAPAEHAEELQIYLKKNNTAPLAFTARGVDYSPAAVTQSGWKMALMHAKVFPAAAKDGMQDTAFLHLSWQDMLEWEVREGMDNPPYYRIRLKTEGSVCFFRPADHSRERALLDYVRTSGQVPVRLWCDITE